ncbi:MAG: hypothetical protein OXF56_04565 [Rhodobacteraceae bacterium]|nr:hypothetical protein [Paracoccaceae bacterium]
MCDLRSPVAVSTANDGDAVLLRGRAVHLPEVLTAAKGQSRMRCPETAAS